MWSYNWSLIQIHDQINDQIYDHIYDQINNHITNQNMTKFGRVIKDRKLATKTIFGH